MAASCHFRYIKQKKTATRVTAIQKQPKRQLRLASHCLIPQKYSAMLISILCVVGLILQGALMSVSNFTIQTPLVLFRMRTYEFLKTHVLNLP